VSILFSNDALASVSSRALTWMLGGAGVLRVRRFRTYRAHLVLKRLDDESPTVHAIGIAADHARVGALAGDFAGMVPV
jgi:hypothetical protein